jgi:hypothetical protein
MEADRNSCTSAWTSLYHVNNVVIILYISLYLAFSMAIYTWKGTFFSQMLMYTSEHTSVCQGFVVEDIVAIFFDSSSGVTVAKPVHEMHIGILFVGK